ncbi:MAG TPA: HAMP domain-containing sensor histidine kinase [Gemmatimonadales bacterium]|jgi:signal transduction histidine kinase|nr:HAMP domain-containing sensor histidine kinase [Gemmatimonadales bacterium]
MMALADAPALDPQAEQDEADRALQGTRALELVVELAHDLRSPVAAILALTELLEGGFDANPLSAGQKRQVGLIRSAALSLTTTASDVMALARRGGGLVERQPMTFSIDAVLRDIQAMLSPIAEQRGLDLIIRTSGRTERVGHPRAVGRVILNLATNALRYTNEGRVEISVRPRAGDQVEFSVADSGPGLPPEGESPASGDRPFSTSGLGLTICRRVLKQLDSELRSESTRGVGTKFWFELELPEVSRRLDG